MDIYLAAAYQRRLEMRGVRDVLQAMGHRVTATWIDDDGPIGGFSAAQLADPEGVNHGRTLARRDIRDIHVAGLVISFTDGAPARGGRHVEFGLAYALGKRLIVVGPREHVFHALPSVEHYPDWAALVHEMAVWAVDQRLLVQADHDQRRA